MAANTNDYRNGNAVSHAQVGLACLAMAMEVPAAAPGLLRVAAYNFHQARLLAEDMRGKPMDEPR